MSDLFGNDDLVIRTLGFYPPFGALMLHGKIETRWVREGRNPPFPNGKYLFYHTGTACDAATMLEWCGPELNTLIDATLASDPAAMLVKSSIGIGDLVTKNPLTKADEDKAYVLFKGKKDVVTKDGDTIVKCQWGMWFENVQRIEPFQFNFGKQGVGILPRSEYDKIKIIR